MKSSDFFSEPEEIERMLKGEPSNVDGKIAKPADDLFGEYIRYHGNEDDILSFEGKQLVKTLKQGFANKKNFCRDDKEFEKYFSIAVARALFETFQQEDANYNDFINRLRVYISFMFRKEAYELVIQHKNFSLYKLSKLKKSFYPSQRKIEEITKEIQRISLTTSQLSGQDKKNAISQMNKLNRERYSEQTKINSMFLTTQDLDFLQKSKTPIISEDSFNQSNNKLLEVIKKKIDETNIIELAKSKFGLKENDEKLQQGEKQLKADLYEAIAKNIKYVTDYKNLECIIEKAIIDRFDNKLNKAIFDMISDFKKYDKNNEPDYRDNGQVMRVYQFIQHVFNAVGYLALEKYNEKDLQMIIFNREEFIFHLSKNSYKTFLIQGKSAFDSLVINLIKGTSLQKECLAENIAWIRSTVCKLDEKTIGAKEMSQFSLAAFNKKNRMLRNGFFNNQRKNNAIQTFFIPLQTIEKQVWQYKIWTNKIKPKLGPKIKMANLNKKCGLTLSDSWEQVSVDQMIKDSKEGYVPDKSYEEYNEEEDVSEDSFESDKSDEIGGNNFNEVKPKTEIKNLSKYEEPILYNSEYEKSDDINNNNSNCNINDTANSEMKLPLVSTYMSYNSNNNRLHRYEKIIYFLVAFIILAALIISLIKLNIMFITVTSILLVFGIIFFCIRLTYVKRINKNHIDIINLNENDKFHERDDLQYPPEEIIDQDCIRR